MILNIKGVIIRNDDKPIYDWLEMDATCPRDVMRAIEAANGEKLDVYINSGGGEIFSGCEMYEALRGYHGEVCIHVVGLAASAASVIMCARHCDISPTGMVMIHNVSTVAAGDYRDMEHESTALKTASESMAAAYILKAGGTAEEWQERMDAETWYSAQQAVALGLCDEISGAEGLQLVASNSGVIPDDVCKRIKGILNAQREDTEELVAAAMELQRLKEVIV